MTAAGREPHDALRGHFARDGYVVVPDLIPQDMLAAIRGDIVAIFALADPDNRIRPDMDLDSDPFHDGLCRLFDTHFDAYLGAAKLCNHAVSLHRLGTDPAIVAHMRKLGVIHPTICARPVVWFHSPRLARSQRYHRLPAHQEWSNMQGSINGMVVWLPLMPLAPDMGRLQAVPGSHMAGMRPLLKGAGDDYPLSMDPEGLGDTDFVEVDVPLGGALLFSPFLIHRSGTNGTARARITANFRFNNAADPYFIDRNMINPFLYEAPSSLVSGAPPASVVGAYFRRMQKERA